ncbi:FAD:protein FMN transferase [Candidatus Pantoea multigeneris]|uniref:FAD:protein FMN transferase n=1 Tax=Candidatus Pantoea multigeneris TaxID=2608357 RepID=A0ABX0REW1_9GAMM|nr:FAD:protein FMN transferase [Pantoea multigeneris]NIF23173.1 FAD:protein FMN transferase [Pantoea multigeneris]
MYDREPSPASYSAVLMGSLIVLKLAEHNATLAQSVFRLISQLEQVFTVNRAQSEVMAINHAAGQHPVVVSAQVFNLIALAKRVSLLPASAFNLAIGPLVKRWKIGFQGDSVPPADEIAALLLLTDPHQVILDVDAQTVFLSQPGMEIDLGAIAKGYIADRVCDYLRLQQVSQALINLGGNVHTLGSATNETGWAIGVKAPFAAAEALIGFLTVRDQSVVTSGIYERYFLQDNHCYHHILDPNTGYPLDNELLSVTVVSDRSIDGDIYTTLLYGMGITQGCKFLADKPGISALFVTRDRQVILSDADQLHFTLLDNRYQLASPTP